MTGKDRETRPCFWVACPREQPLDGQTGPQVRWPEEPLSKGAPNLHDAPDGPHVHLEAVPFLAQHLGGYVIRGPAQGLLPLAVVFDFGCQSKIPWTGRGRGGTQKLACDHREPGASDPSGSTPCPQPGLPRDPLTVLAQGAGLSMTLLAPPCSKEG